MGIFGPPPFTILKDFTGSFVATQAHKNEFSLVQVTKRSRASSLRLNPFATYVKERLLPSTKNTVTELWVIEFVS